MKDYDIGAVEDLQDAVRDYVAEHIALKARVAAHQARAKELVKAYEELKVDCVELDDGTKVPLADQRKCKVADVDEVEAAAREAGLKGVVKRVKKVVEKQLYAELKRVGLHALRGLRLYHVRVLQVHLPK